MTHDREAQDLDSGVGPITPHGPAAGSTDPGDMTDVRRGVRPDGEGCDGDPARDARHRRRAGMTHHPDASDASRGSPRGVSSADSCTATLAALHRGGRGTDTRTRTGGLSIPELDPISRATRTLIGSAPIRGDGARSRSGPRSWIPGIGVGPCIASRVLVAHQAKNAELESTQIAKSAGSYPAK